MPELIYNFMCLWPKKWL